MMIPTALHSDVIFPITSTYFRVEGGMCFPLDLKKMHNEILARTLQPDVLVLAF